ncbi:hypothetical protein [Dyella tabacisoli]|uniref:Uncharacterized protein n=1 Tax=Dyella tabacisoli TaxID=2282381 RepID=A0A369UPD2_9GAMM|nr:hypothetical protein [Dyella tabacisoli]RDD82193.1 hypothetical protein DVJ77_07130 [Dyella tabacisoli]
MANHSGRRDHANDLQKREEDVRQQSERHWADFLNATLGVIGFPLGLACLSTKTPSINGALCFVFVLSIWVNNRRLMPKHFREASKNTSWRGFWNNVKFWLRTAPAVMGYVYLLLVALSHPIYVSCTTKYQCPVIADWIKYYVGAP